MTLSRMELEISLEVGDERLAECLARVLGQVREITVSIGADDADGAGEDGPAG